MKNKIFTNSMRFILSVFIASVSCQISNAQIPGCHSAFTHSKEGNTVSFLDASWFDVGPKSTTWSWDFGDGTTSTLQNPIHTYTLIKPDYNACLSVSNCSTMGGLCCTDKYCFIVNLNIKGNGDQHSAGVNTADMKNFVISPNPANNFINISLPATSSNSQIEISNIIGEIVIKTENREMIDVSTLIKGVYFVKVQDGEMFYSQKFVKQ